MMTTELMRIPGMNGSKKIRLMMVDSKKRMNDATKCQLVAAAMMSSRRHSEKKGR